MRSFDWSTIAADWHILEKRAGKAINASRDCRFAHFFPAEIVLEANPQVFRCVSEQFQ